MVNTKTMQMLGKYEQYGNNARKRLYAGTVPANKEYATGTVSANKKYAAVTLKKLKFRKISIFPSPSKYPLVRPQKCQDYVQRLKGNLISEGNQLLVILPL